MKNLKKILALCLAGMMVFSMAACGGAREIYRWAIERSIPRCRY